MAIRARRSVFEANPYTKGPSRSQDGRGLPLDDEARQKLREDGVAPQASLADVSQVNDNRNPLGAIGNDAPTGKGKGEPEDRGRPEPVDPLAGMPEIDKWGIKGLRTLMSTYPDYNALTLGIDPSSLGLDLSSPEYALTHETSDFPSASNLLV